jgi:hypothetical protein
LVQDWVQQRCHCQQALAQMLEKVPLLRHCPRLGLGRQHCRAQVQQALQVLVRVQAHQTAQAQALAQVP